ncbi:mRNA splicing protein [Mitosporidium daphniae]
MSSSTASITSLLSKPRSELTQEELKAIEIHEFETGPLSLIKRAMKSRTMVLISCRSNKKLLAKVKAFDRHCNMVLENVKEMWVDTPRGGGKNKRQKTGRPLNRDRFISKMFLRGDSVILTVLTNIPTE